MKHLLVIPTYNEIENIEKIINEIFHLYPELSILIVDDSSPDKTAEKAAELQKVYPNLYLIVREGKQGLGSAYIQGFKWGLKNGYELFSTCDADFSHKPCYLKDAIEKIQSGCDVACGSRFIKNGYTTEKHWFRNLLTIGGNVWANFILKTDIKDLMEGFNTYTKTALEKINIDKVSAKGFIFQTEMKFRALKAGCRVEEFPIIFEERTLGKSKMTLNIIIEALFQIILLKFKH